MRNPLAGYNAWFWMDSIVKLKLWEPHGKALGMNSRYQPNTKINIV